ncbi:uncharacterized protein LOC117623819 isoform X1 [Prunus dulcis]|uniref:uncharacterized protein LOC117623819 isoform X1 n=1 Tax=Prunus dulcis TaxID=3755 RepID=UPI001483413D|nr:uncharacterized protein LOC117623819 isoform X1 [Prunus dulcis]
MEGILGQNRLEDVSWLCSLSESELDMLISLKSIVLQRARMIGHEELANNFDLKMLRALAFVLMECIRDKVKDLTLAESAAFMESCNLLKYNLGDIMSLEEIRACIGINSRKGPIKSTHHSWNTNPSHGWHKHDVSLLFQKCSFLPKRHAKVFKGQKCVAHMQCIRYYF